MVVRLRRWPGGHWRRGRGRESLYVGRLSFSTLGAFFHLPSSSPYHGHLLGWELTTASASILYLVPSHP